MENNESQGDVHAKEDSSSKLCSKMPQNKNNNKTTHAISEIEKKSIRVKKLSKINQQLSKFKNQRVQHQKKKHDHGLSLVDQNAHDAVPATMPENSLLQKPSPQYIPQNFIPPSHIMHQQQQYQYPNQFQQLPPQQQPQLTPQPPQQQQPQPQPQNTQLKHPIYENSMPPLIPTYHPPHQAMLANTVQYCEARMRESAAAYANAAAHAAWAYSQIANSTLSSQAIVCDTNTNNINTTAPPFLPTSSSPPQIFLNDSSAFVCINSNPSGTNLDPNHEEDYDDKNSLDDESSASDRSKQETKPFNSDAIKENKKQSEKANEKPDDADNCNAYIQPETANLEINSASSSSSASSSVSNKEHHEVHTSDYEEEEDGKTKRMKDHPSIPIQNSKKQKRSASQQNMCSSSHNSQPTTTIKPYHDKSPQIASNNYDNPSRNSGHNASWNMHVQMNTDPMARGPSGIDSNHMNTVMTTPTSIDMNPYNNDHQIFHPQSNMQPYQHFFPTFPIFNNQNFDASQARSNNIAQNQFSQQNALANTQHNLTKSFKSSKRGKTKKNHESKTPSNSHTDKKQMNYSFHLSQLKDRQDKKHQQCINKCKQAKHKSQIGRKHDIISEEMTQNATHVRKGRYRDKTGSDAWSGERNHRNSDCSKDQNNSIPSASGSDGSGGLTLKPFHPIGKTGVSALYELCDNRHWPPPRFKELESNTIDLYTPSDVSSGVQSGEENSLVLSSFENNMNDNQVTSTKSSNITHPLHSKEFIISVEVDGGEMGRGRGGTKKSAQQDAARRALMTLCPEVKFDTNGILIHIGDYDKQHKSALTLEDLVASRLAIDTSTGGGNGCVSVGSGQVVSPHCQSPALSEDSSLSCSVSTPHSVTKKYNASGCINPCASTTSGVSSASDDDDYYYASRGASVCSALLHVMAQIDERIKGTPSYTFSECDNPATILEKKQHENDVTILTSELNNVDEVLPCGGIKGLKTTKGSTKRKGGGQLGVANSNPSKKQNATNDVGKVVSIHRSSFACKASLTLHAPPRKFVVSNNTSTHEKQKNENSDSSSKTLDRQIENKSPSTYKPSNKMDSKSISSDHLLNNNQGLYKRNENIDADSLFEHLVVIGTGATKREAKHVASAKLLTLLFPECTGMVEVIKSAEAVREKHAAKKALSKQLKRSSTFFARKKMIRTNSLSSRDDYLKNKKIFKKELLKDDLTSPIIFHRDGEPLMAVDFSNRLNELLSIRELKEKNEASEPVDTNEQDFCSTNHTPIKLLGIECNDKEGIYKGEENQYNEIESSFHQHLLRQKQLEEQTEDALRALNECDDEKRFQVGQCNVDDVGRIVLRKATVDDRSLIFKLLCKEDLVKQASAPLYSQLSNLTDAPLSLLNICLQNNDLQNNCFSCDLSGIACCLWGGESVTLVLTRAIPGRDEPPLGCAILTQTHPVNKCQAFRISQIFHESHLPRERFVECLELFSQHMNCSLIDQDDLHENASGYSLNQHSIENMVDTIIEKEQRVLQSVKEEECEDEDEEKNTNELSVNNNEGNENHKPSKRTRVV